MGAEPRSLCPINLSLEVLGDRWSLLVIRDMMFGGRRYFRELMRSEEGISSNVLADRLARLAEQGLITRAGDPAHRQKVRYSLTEKAIDLVPVFVQLGAWGIRHLPVSPAFSVRARVLEEGGSRMWAAFQNELRRTHLGEEIEADPDYPSVLEVMQRAYREALGVAGDGTIHPADDSQSVATSSGQ